MPGEVDKVVVTRVATGGGRRPGASTRRPRKPLVIDGLSTSRQRSGRQALAS